MGFVSKLGLNNKKTRDIVKITKEYNIAKIFNFLGYISAKKLGSTTFWKYCYYFVYDILTSDELLETIKIEDRNNFIIDCYKIYGLRSIPPNV